MSIIYKTSITIGIILEMYKHCKRHIMLIYQSLVAVPPLHLKLPFNSYRYYATKYSFRDYKEL